MSVVMIVLALIGGLALFVVLVSYIAALTEGRTKRKAKPSTKQLDPIADLLETKASIRTDELMRWAEAWQRAAQSPDLGTTIREIQTVERVAVAEHRQQERERERIAAIEAREADRIARELAVSRLREEREEERMSPDTAMPAALFELESEPMPVPTSRPITRRPGHQIRAHNAPGRLLIACTCGDHSPVYTHPDGATNWAYQHLDIVYDTDIEEAVNA